MKYLYKAQVAEPLATERAIPPVQILYEIDVEPSEFPRKFKHAKFTVGPELSKKWTPLPDTLSREFFTWLNNLPTPPKKVENYKPDIKNPHQNWSIEETAIDAGTENEYASEALTRLATRVHRWGAELNQEWLDKIAKNQHLSEEALTKTAELTLKAKKPGNLELLKAIISNPNLKQWAVTDKTKERLEKEGISTYKLTKWTPPEPKPEPKDDEPEYIDGYPTADNGVEEEE